MYFSSKGSGDLNIQCSVGSIVSEIIAILDTKAHYDNSKIPSWGTSRGSNFTNYNSSYALSDGDVAYFKLASLPNVYVIGLVDGSSYFQLQRVQNTNTARIYTDGVSSSDYSHTFSADDVIKFERVSSTQQKVYINDTLIHTASNHSFSNPKPMIRKYDNQEYNMDYIYIL